MCKAVCFMPGKWSRTYMSVTAEALSMTADEHCLVI